MKLKPCPWCKQLPETQRGYTGNYKVMCMTHDCPVRPATNFYPLAEDAEHFWNTRARKTK